MSQHLTTYSFARLKITISFFLPNSLEYEMIVHRMYKTKKTTATLGANHLRLYLFTSDRDIKIVQTINLVTIFWNHSRPHAPSSKLFPQDFLHLL